MAVIWLVRHGQTEWSRDGRHTGRTDVPLTPAGEQEARALVDELKDVAPGLVLCSPLERARETARLAGLVPSAYTDDLLEWDYGRWEGRTTAEIRRELGDPRWLIWSHPIPAGDTPGEQLSAVAERVGRVIDRCAPVLAAGDDCVLVAHGHVLRVLTASWLGQSPAAARLYALDPARVSSLGFEHEDHVIRSWNSTSA